MALTLEQVAKLAGVSCSTVSRVVNEHPSVLPKVRERVWQVIRAKNYRLDGAIVAAAPTNDPVLPRLQASHRPCVLVGHHPDYPKLPFVDVDNVAGSKFDFSHGAG